MSLGSMRTFMSGLGSRLSSTLSGLGSRTASALATAADIGNGLGQAAKAVAPVVSLINPVAGAGMGLAGEGLSAGSDAVKKVSSSLLK